MKKFAYVTFIIKNDSFVPGAMVLAYSLIKQNTSHDIVCIVSEEVSDTAVDILSKLYTRVIKQDSLTVKHKNTSGRQDRSKLFSRFNCLLLTEYEKIVLLDADILTISNYDSLFELNTPAGIINESKDNCIESSNNKYIIPDYFETENKWIWHKTYESICKHGETIPSDITDRVLTDYNNLGVNSGIYVLTPSIDLYNSILDDLSDEGTLELINNFNWPEMQYFTQKMSGKWTNMDIKFGSFSGYPKVEALYGMHFTGAKPWSFKNKSIYKFARFEDYKLWYHTYVNMTKDYPELLRYNKINKILFQIEDILKEEQNKFKDIPENVKHLVSRRKFNG